MWNENLQKCLKEEAPLKYELLSQLGNDFVSAATKYGKIIISELYLPYHQKTIKPVDAGGIMGGEKYLCQGIFFKFALDRDDNYEGDHNAMKSAGHELKSLINIYNCGIQDLFLPLMAIVDYKGFRLTCLSNLPINNQTLIYGSKDAGKTIFQKNTTFNNKMKEIGEKLNICGHKLIGSVDKKEVFVYYFITYYFIF